MKKYTILLVLSLMLLSCVGCGKKQPTEKTTINLAAAASLKKAFEEELIPLFNEKHPEITVVGTYDSSGKLQTQIEEGMDVDVFFSAANKQMNALVEEGLIESNSVNDVLINQLVLIVPVDSTLDITSFEDVSKVTTLAIGDPESVPAGQYAKELLTNIGLYDQVSKTASLGSNVTEVLNWVAEGSAEAGIVYKSDAVTNDQVKVVAVATTDMLTTTVSYPMGLASNSTNPEAAKLFMEFLQSDEAFVIFEKYGFASAK